MCGVVVVFENAERLKLQICNACAVCLRDLDDAKEVEVNRLDVAQFAHICAFAYLPANLFGRACESER